MKVQHGRATVIGEALAADESDTRRHNPITEGRKIPEGGFTVEQHFYVYYRAEASCPADFESNCLASRRHNSGARGLLLRRRRSRSHVGVRQ